MASLVSVLLGTGSAFAMTLAANAAALPSGGHFAAGKGEIGKAGWAAMTWEGRAAIFLKAADLMSTKYRAYMNGTTMLGQSKNAFQAEIDSACELIDFLRWNVHFLSEIYRQQLSVKS